MIFLSYAKEDAERSGKIFSMISKPNRVIFYDKESLLPGMDWEFEIEQKLDKCSLIIILCTANSVNKEGFIQREIRMALQRAECMPDGRIFIIPIRFDQVELPRKLKKYQWIDVNNDHDYYDIQFFIDILWDRLMGSKIQAGVEGPTNYKLDNVLLREKVVILIEGKNVAGEQIYTFLELTLWKLSELRRAMADAQDFSPADYGVPLASGKGAVPPELVAKMRNEHNMINIPKPVPSVDEDLAALIRNQYTAGFNEAFRGILGNQAVLPLIKTPDEIPEGSNALREGIKMGMAVATAQLKKDGQFGSKDSELR